MDVRSESLRKSASLTGGVLTLPAPPRKGYPLGRVYFNSPEIQICIQKRVEKLYRICRIPGEDIDIQASQLAVAFEIILRDPVFVIINGEPVAELVSLLVIPG